MRYPWHPLANTEVIVCGGTSHLGVASYLVTLPDGTMCALPIWMTETHAAGDAVVRDVGLASRPALEALRSLVDEVRGEWARSADAVSVSSTSGDPS